MKAACPVREEAVRKGPSGDTTCNETGGSTEYNGTSLAAYFIPSSGGSTGNHGWSPVPVALCHLLAPSLAGLHKRYAHILMEHLSLRSHTVSLSQSATPVTPSHPPFCYTCRRNSQMTGKQVEAALLFTHCVQDP